VRTEWVQFAPQARSQLQIALTRSPEGSENEGDQLSRCCRRLARFIPLNRFQPFHSAVGRDVLYSAADTLVVMLTQSSSIGCGPEERQ
jgi:hypothetical protein